MDRVISTLLSSDVAGRYIAQVLALGGASPSEPLGLCLRAPPYFAIVPEGIGGDELLNFDRGGMLRAMPVMPRGEVSVQRVPTTIPMATTLVLDAMKRLDQAVFMVHEPILTDDELARKNIPYARIGEKLFLVSAPDADDNGIATLMRYGLFSWHFLAFVIDRHTEINTVDELVVAAKLMLVGAYDGESFLYSVQM